MLLQKFFVLPGALIVVTVGYIAINPGGSTVATPVGDETVVAGTILVATEAPLEATATATTTPTPSPEGELPDGLTGRLTYRTGDEFVTVQFPEAAVVDRFRSQATAIQETEIRTGWRAEVTSCGWANSCEVVLSAHDVAPRSFRTEGVVSQVEVSRDGSSVAFTTAGGGGHPTAYKLWIVDFDDAGGATPRLLLTTNSGLAHPFTWLGDESLLIADNTETNATLLQVTRDGEINDLARTGAPVWYLYPSPHGTRVAYTQDEPEGWRLHAIDTATREVLDYGNMGSDQPGGRPPEQSPAGKGPIYVAWSPDGSMLAFGGGLEPPYTMTTVLLLETGTRVRTEFVEGYPGEIKWSPDGQRIGVSTYDPERTRHETYVVDPYTGAATFLLSGCVIVWAADSRFIAVHGEGTAGVAIADVDSGEVGWLTHVRDDTPLRWLPDAP